MPIRVKCPSCGRGIKAPSKYAGKIAKCPGCGNKLQVPIPSAKEKPPTTVEPTTSPAAPPVAPVAVVPAPGTVVQQAAMAKEQDLLKINPAMLRTRPVATIVLGFAILFTLLVSATNTSETPQLWLIPLILSLLFVVWFLESKTTSLTITTKRSILRKGILSKRTREVRHSDVRLLQVDQSLFQRLMKVGTVSIASAGHGEVEIAVSGIKDPEHIKETIDGYRN
ncbi:MAG: PH domain-containing protein [Planctomycetes bacterium]|nr:PH domain-containing protein [Planctomycetota bacterium]